MGIKVTVTLIRQIAVVALANNLVLVTGNVRHYSRIPRLQVEDWFTSK